MHNEATRRTVRIYRVFARLPREAITAKKYGDDLYIILFLFQTAKFWLLLNTKEIVNIRKKEFGIISEPSQKNN